MYSNFIYDDVNHALPELLHRLHDGEEIGSRAGRTKELTHVGITLREPVNREILLPHRKPNIAAQIAETMWVLAGHDDIGWLGHYLPRAKDFSDDGHRWRAGYGARLRNWEDHAHAKTIDQFRWLVEHLKEDPASRRAVMSIWDPVTDTIPGKDIPCNDWLSFSSRFGKLDLHVAVRSNDVIWGWSGINQFEWSTLLEVTAGLLGVEVGSLHFSTTSFHIYDRHWAKSDKIIDHAYRPTGLLPSPRFDASVIDRDFDQFDSLLDAWFMAEKAIRNGDMLEHLVDSFPEPMMRSWLRVLQWWWSGEREYLSVLEGTRLERAVAYSVQPPERERTEIFVASREKPVLTILHQPEHSPFITEICSLHDEKHAAYGDSWKRRGEMLGIMANIARKIDRLGKGETSDETSADTAADLMVYLAKYRVWLDVNVHGSAHDYDPSDFTDGANEIMRDVDRRNPTTRFTQEQSEEWLRKTFDRLEDAVNRKDRLRYEIVEDMLFEAYVLARTLWEKENGDEYRGADVD